MTFLVDPAATTANALPEHELVRYVPIASEDDAVSAADRPLVEAIAAHDVEEVIRLLNEGER